MTRHSCTTAAGLLAAALAAGCSGNASQAASGVSGSGGNAPTSGPGGAGGSSSAGGSGGAAPAPGCPDVKPDTVIQEQLPQATVDTTMPQQAGQTISVKAGGDLNAAIAAAQPGDTLALEAGATFTGPFVLPQKSGDGWIVIRTATADADFAMPGTRVSPALAPKMAKLVADSEPVTVATGAGRYRLIGLEVTSTPGKFIYATIDLTVKTATETDLAHDIIVDRCYLHADLTSSAGARRGVALNAKSAAVIDSYLSGFREQGADSQAIGGWTGPGPYLVRNDYLEGASENVLFGGADPTIANLVPSDIQICGNHFKKDLSWKGGGWAVKNLLELKNARRVLVAGNILEYNWADAQAGLAVLFTPRNQNGAAPWSGVSDVTFAYNIVRHTASGLDLLGSDDGQPSQPLARAVVHDNLFDDLGAAQYGGDGREFQLVHGKIVGHDIKIDHNTATGANNAAWAIGDSAPIAGNVVFTNNIAAHGQYGVFGSGQGEGKKALDFYLTSYTFDHNAIFGGGSANAYPAGNFFPPTQADVGFAASFALTAGSKYKNAGSDGKDLGADIAGLLAATSGVAP